VCASEVGDQTTLERLLAYADRFLQPSWDKGGRYYPRQDEAVDSAGYPIAMDPHTGNALLGYARLNVPHGLRKLYDDPWDDAHFSSPALVDMTPALDVRRAWFERDQPRLTLTLGPLHDQSTLAALTIGNHWGRGDWTLNIDGTPIASGNEREVARCKGIDLKRVDNALVIELPVNRFLTITIDWADSARQN
jgi:hypothetical protein